MIVFPCIWWRGAHGFNTKRRADRYGGGCFFERGGTSHACEDVYFIAECTRSLRLDTCTCARLEVLHFSMRVLLPASIAIQFCVFHALATAVRSLFYSEVKGQAVAPAVLPHPLPRLHFCSCRLALPALFDSLLTCNHYLHNIYV